MPTFGTLTKVEYQQHEMKLRIIAPVRDNVTGPDKKIFQWGLLMIEMHKRSGETQCGYRTRYFHSAYNGATNDQRTSFVDCIKHKESKIKALVKSNFDSKKTGFDYKRIRKEPPPEPMHLDTVTTTIPNDSGIAVLLTVAVIVNRTPFWSDPAKVISLHKKSSWDLHH